MTQSKNHSPNSESFSGAVPPAVVEIIKRLVDAGYETWCVGGGVRDVILGRQSLDWDLATAAQPKVVRHLFRRTVPVGVEFGTVGVFDSSGVMREVTTFRRDVLTDGRHAVVEFGASLEQDLARRDFTINAVAYNPITNTLRDPFGGRIDLSNRIVRAVGVAAERMREDRLRALRAIRFAARFNFDIETSTWNAINDSAPFLPRLSPERVKQEIEKTMEQAVRPSRAFRMWRDCGAFSSLVPALSSITDDSLNAIDAVPVASSARTQFRRSLRIALLLSELSESECTKTLKALRFSNLDVSWISTLVERWHSVGPHIQDALCSGQELSGETVRKWAALIGRTRIQSFSRVVTAKLSVSGSEGASITAKGNIRSLHRRLLTAAFNEPIEIADLAVDGDDIRSAGVPPGPLLGSVLQQLLQQVLVNPSLNSREKLLERVPIILLSLGNSQSNVGRAE